MSKENNFFEMESNEDAVRIVEMTQKDSIYYIKLVGKAAGEFENLVKQSTMGKILPNNIAWYRRIFCERKSQSMWQISLLSFFFSKELPKPPLLSATTTLISQQLYMRQDPPLKRNANDG